MQLNQNDLEYLKDQMQQGRMTAAQANVQKVRMQRVLLVHGRLTADHRKALNANYASNAMNATNPVFQTLLNRICPPVKKHPAGDFDSTVAGIPCRIEIGHCEPYTPARISGPPEDCYPAEGGEIEFQVFDSRGRPAPWLAKKITAKDEARIEQEIINFR